MIQIERWICVKCGSPCKVEIHFTHSKLPGFLKGRDKFRSKECLCRESLYPEWTKVSEINNQ